MTDPTLTTFTIRVDPVAKDRLEQLAKSTGYTPSVLAAEAIDAYLDVNEWQVAGINVAMASLDRGEGVAHADVKRWLASWGTRYERPGLKRSTS